MGPIGMSWASPNKGTVVLGVPMKDAILISGWHSDSNPSSGLGIAHSVKEAFPRLKIIALDYSSRCTGLYDPIVDERILLPRWEEVDIRTSMMEIADAVHDRNALYVSGLDMEIFAIARELRAMDRTSFLLPDEEALRLTAKPAGKLAERLGLSIPETAVHHDIVASVQQSEAMGWPVLVKGLHHEARVAGNYRELVSCIRYIEETWGDTPILQQFCYGREECISFSAYRGKLLGAVAMRKTEVTFQGKTWCGQIEEVPPEFLSRLSTVLQGLHWTGGGEIETIWDDVQKKRVLIDFNPRFPAWIYGATVCGTNLPGRLVAAALLAEPLRERPPKAGFVRIVKELPSDRVERNVFVRARVHPQTALKGHPSGSSALSKKSRLAPEMPREAEVESDESCLEVLDKAMAADYPSLPDRRLFVPAKFGKRAAFLKSMCEALRRESGLDGKLTYSLKTNPAPAVLQELLRLECGMETITLDEYLHALRSGFPGEQCILNGPGKWVGNRTGDELPEPAAIQCDSLGDLRETMLQTGKRGWHGCQIGIRISPLFHESRFGMDVSNPDVFSRLCAALPDIAKQHGLGIHFHFAESTVGIGDWLREIESVAVFAQHISRAAGVDFKTFDFGGGWRTRELEVYAETMGKAVELVHRRLPALESVCFEPGKLLVEDAMLLLTKIVGFRERGEKRDVILDTAINEVPDAGSFPHEMLWYDKKNRCWMRLADGNERVLGCICMESDILRGDVALPRRMEAGDFVAIKSVGAYDASMAFPFGTGCCCGRLR